MENYSVYIHRFPNGKNYIGITSQLIKRRWCRGSTYSYHKRMFNAIKKYGWENIQHEVLYSGLSKMEAEKIEIELIKSFKSYLYEFGYNRDLGGNSTGKVSEQSKIKMSIAKLGTKKSKEFCEMIKNVHIGNSYRKGKNHSSETKERMRIAKIGNTYNAKKIVQMTLSDEIIKFWDSISEVERELGFKNSCIVSNLKGRSKSSYGFKWKYYE